MNRGRKIDSWPLSSTCWLKAGREVQPTVHTVVAVAVVWLHVTDEEGMQTSAAMAERVIRCFMVLQMAGWQTPVRRRYCACKVTNDRAESPLARTVMRYLATQGAPGPMGVTLPWYSIRYRGDAASAIVATASVGGE